jgi:hypothetical protein
MGCGIHPGGVHDRVVAPDRGARPETAAQFAQLRHRLGHGDDRAFERAGVAGQRELHDKRRDPADFVEIGHQRPHVAGPEDKAVHRFRGQRDLVGAAAIGIGDAAITGAQSAHQPLRVKRWNIGAIAGGHDHAERSRDTKPEGGSRLQPPRFPHIYNLRRSPPTHRGLPTLPGGSKRCLPGPFGSAFD